MKMATGNYVDYDDSNGATGANVNDDGDGAMRDIDNNDDDGDANEDGNGWRVVGESSLHNTLEVFTNKNYVYVR